MSNKTKLRLIGLSIFLIGTGLCVYWFDWKLWGVIMILMWGNNIERRADK